MKEQIVNLCNQELARRPSAPEAEAATGEAAIEKEPQDTPIVRGYNFLRQSSFVRFELELQLTSVRRTIGVELPDRGALHAGSPAVCHCLGRTSARRPLEGSQDSARRLLDVGGFASRARGEVLTLPSLPLPFLLLSRPPSITDPPGTSSRINSPSRLHLPPALSTQSGNPETSTAIPPSFRPTHRDLLPQLPLHLLDPSYSRRFGTGSQRSEFGRKECGEGTWAGSCSGVGSGSEPDVGCGGSAGDRVEQRGPAG